jgi:hypothetical protein
MEKAKSKKDDERKQESARHQSTVSHGEAWRGTVSPI